MAESPVTPTDIEISNQRAAALTAARARIARLRRRLSLYKAENARMRAHGEMALNEGRTGARLRERIGELIGARGLEMLSDVARYDVAGPGMTWPGLTVTRAGRGVRMTGEAGHRLSLAIDDLSILLMPGDILQNDDHIAAGHPGVEYLGNEGKGKGKGSPQPFTGQGNRLGE